MQRTYKLYLISLLTLNSLCLSAEPIPLFDTHLHYNTDAVGQFDPQAVIQKLDSAGIEKVLVSSTDDSGTQELLKLAPSRVVPALRPYRQPGTIKTWMYDESVIEHLDSKLAQHTYIVFGEFHAFEEVRVRRFRAATLSRPSASCGGVSFAHPPGGRCLKPDPQHQLSLSERDKSPVRIPGESERPMRHSGGTPCASGSGARDSTSNSSPCAR